MASLETEFRQARGRLIDSGLVKTIHEKTLESSPRDKWESVRSRFPELRLTPIGPDNLAWLYAGRPDPSASRLYFDRISTSFFKGLLSDAAEQLLEFSQQHPFTFNYSGWVDAALGATCLQDERAALKFLKPYWKQARKPLPQSTMAAFEALRQVDGAHRRHWLAAIQWMKHFYDRTNGDRGAGRYFVSEAPQAYRQRLGAKHRSCLTETDLKAIAKAITERPNSSATALCDAALAIVFPKTSASTIAHLRASVKRSRSRP